MILTGRDLDRTFRKLGAEVHETKHHLKAFLTRRGQKLYPPIYIPMLREVPASAQRKILSSLHLSRQQFAELTSCRLDADTYFEMRQIDKPQDWTKEAITLPVLLDRFGVPLDIASTAAGGLIIAATHELRDDLIGYVRDQPSRLHEMSSREFEIFIETLLKKSGYSTVLTRPIGDGGKDVIVASESDLGKFMFLVECKKYSPDTPVGVNLVRELYGVVEEQRATAGLLVTTSRFTKGAQDFQKNVSYRLALKDYVDLVEWVSNVT